MNGRRTVRAWVLIGLVASSLLLGTSPRSRLDAAVTREEVERAIRDGVRFLTQAQRGDGSWPDVHTDTKTGTTSLVTLALLTAGEKKDSPSVRAALDYLRKFGPDQLNSTYAIALQTMVYAAAEPERDQSAHRRQRELARIRPDQGGRPDPLAWLLDLFELETDPARRQLEHPVRPARPQCRQRGRRTREARGVGPFPRLLGAVPEARRKLGLHARFHGLDGQHDLRGDLQPGDHRSETVPGPGIARGGADPQLRQGRAQSQVSSAGSTGWPITFRSARTTATASSGSFTISMAWNGRAGWRAFASSASTTGTAWAPRSSCTSRTGSRASGRVSASRATRSSPPASPSSSWPRAAPRSWSTSCATAPGTTGTTIPTTSATSSSVVSRRLEEPPHLAGRRPGRRLRRRPPPGPHRLLQRAPGPRVQCPGQAEPPRLRRAGGLPLRRRLLPQQGIRRRLQAAHEGALPRGGVQAAAPLRRPPGLAGQAPADPGRLSALGHRARLPDRRHLLAQGPLVLLEPGRARRRTTARSSWPPGSVRTSSTTPPARSFPPTSSSSARFTTSRPPRSSAMRCGSPSSSMPAAGTWPRWRFPTSWTPWASLRSTSPW